MKHECSENLLGDCSLQCPWCKIFGFYTHYQTGDRKYSMCKWCGKVQTEGDDVVQCEMEVCPKCCPKYESFEEHEISNKETSLGTRDMSTKKTFYPTWTMRPGHPCIKCETKMVVFKPKIKINQAIKDALYKFHHYNETTK